MKGHKIFHLDLLPLNICSLINFVCIFIRDFAYTLKIYIDYFDLWMGREGWGGAALNTLTKILNIDDLTLGLC